MIRVFTASAVALALAAVPVIAQDGPLRRAGRALDQAGKDIRSGIETEVARGQITAQERDVLHRVGKRIDWDKQMAGSTLRLEVQPGGVVILQGSVPSIAARRRAVDLVENTTGVTSVVDQLAIADTTRVIQAPSSVIETQTSTPVVEVERPIVVPPATRVIVKP